MLPSLSNKHKKILKGSIFVSLCVHMASLIFLQRQSLWFSPAQPVEMGPTSWLTSMEKKEKDQILKETFQCTTREQTSSLSPHAETISISLPKTDPSFPIEGENENLASFLPPDLFPKGELLASNLSISFALPSNEKLNLFEHLPKDLIGIALAPSAPLLPLPPPLTTTTSFSAPSAPPLPEVPNAAIDVNHLPPVAPAWSENSPVLTKTPSFLPAPHLPKIPSLSELQTVSYSDSFETELVFLSQDNGEYLFALTLIPKSDLLLKPIRQNYFFLIDRSNAIQKERLLVTKNAVRKAIEELNGGGDSFNIIAFDSKLEKLSTLPLPANSESIEKAKFFLDKIELGSFFSQSDLFKALFLTIPSVVKEDELYTAILLTDGENFGKKGTLHTILSDWSRYNDGRVSLFTVAMGHDLQLNALETASVFNRGKLFVSPTKRGLKRKLLKLMKTVHAPVSKNLSCRAIAKSPHSAIELLPKGSQTPHLFLNEPYIILGKANSLDDFILFVQGRLNGEWLHIKKTISFTNAKKGHSSLKAEWALQKAYELYDQYLSDNNPEHIAEVRALLEPHELQIAFE